MLEPCSKETAGTFESERIEKSILKNTLINNFLFAYTLTIIKIRFVNLIRILRFLDEKKMSQNITGGSHFHIFMSRDVT